jgi:hypothetical protein
MILCYEWDRYDARCVVPDYLSVEAFGALQHPFGSWVSGLHDSW